MKIAIILFAFLMNFALVAQTVTIGRQVWMTTNLNVTEFRNGDPIPMAGTKEEWDRAGYNKQPAWCYYNNDPANGEKYGKLYNWYAVNDPRGLAPVGYHIPSDSEWALLKSRLGKELGTKLKSAEGWSNGATVCPDCSNWNREYRSKVPCQKCMDTRTIPFSANGTNTFGFSANPGGYRMFYGTFEDFSNSANWWGSTDGLAYPAKCYSIDNNGGGLKKSIANKGKGLSVRCIKN